MAAKEAKRADGEVDEELLNDKSQCCYCCVPLCTGGCPVYVSFFTWPCVLLWNCIRVYLWPCVYVLFGTCLEKLFCWCCRTKCISCYLYEDSEFERLNRSLALLEPENEDNRFKSSILKELDDSQGIRLQAERIDWEKDGQYHRIEWKRASEVASGGDGKTYLFHDGIEPGDVAQGKLGNCWLLAAVASLAEFPGAIENCFVTYGTNPRHKYKIRIYDARKDRRKWQVITIDDFVPTHCVYNTQDERNSGFNATYMEPIFATPKGNEMWVLLLEKAFAKYCGSYSELSGGHAMWAMQAITGDYCSRWEFNNNSMLEDGIGQEENKLSYWKRYVMEYGESQSRNPKKDWRLKRTLNDIKYKETGDPTQDYNHDFMHKLIADYDSKKSLIVASIMKLDGMDNEDSLGDTGLVVGHTYTVTKVGEFKIKNSRLGSPDLVLIRMRNPWGAVEWKLDWNDADPRWEQNIYKKVWNQMMSDDESDTPNAAHKDDGTFLISKEDFFKHFNVIQICHRSTIRDLCLSIQEEDGSCGVVTGCCKSCCKYWCCDGCAKIYFGERTSTEVVDTRSFCTRLCDSCSRSG